MLRSWFRMREECPTCALALERGEREDYWLGAYMLNLVAAELVAMGIGVAIIVGSWPDVPWTGVWILTIVLAVASPLAFFPFSRTLWLAGDLHFRPHEPGDMPDERYRPVRPPR